MWRKIRDGKELNFPKFWGESDDNEEKERSELIIAQAAIRETEGTSKTKKKAKKRKRAEDREDMPTLHPGAKSDLKLLSLILMHKFLIWNVGGLANKRTLNRVKSLCGIHKVTLLVIIEPKMQVSKVPAMQMKLGFANAKAGCKDIWTMAKDSLYIQARDYWEQALSVEVTNRTRGSKFLFFAMHRGPMVKERSLLWGRLLAVRASCVDWPWFCGGDFNAILKQKEKSGGLRPDARSMFDFSQFVLQQTWRNSYSQVSNSPGAINKRETNIKSRDLIGCLGI